MALVMKLSTHWKGQLILFALQGLPLYIYFAYGNLQTKVIAFRVSKLT
jgi:hypothetical protein